MQCVLRSELDLGNEGNLLFKLFSVKNFMYLFPFYLTGHN